MLVRTLKLLLRATVLKTAHNTAANLLHMFSQRFLNLFLTLKYHGSIHGLSLLLKSILNLLQGHIFILERRCTLTGAPKTHNRFLMLKRPFRVIEIVFSTG